MIFSGFVKVDYGSKNKTMKFKEELKLNPDVMFQPLVYIELAYKEGLLEEIAYAIKI